MVTSITSSVEDRRRMDAPTEALVRLRRTLLAAVALLALAILPVLIVGAAGHAPSSLVAAATVPALAGALYVVASVSNTIPGRA
jgi:peptidoglycan/LPS O-acetylase OafA/YrhL